MRSTKLGAALAAAATVLALTPAGAGAVKAGACSVTELVEPHRVTSGETVLVSGAVTCLGAPAAEGTTVTLYERSVGVPGFKVVGTPKTGKEGAYTFTSTPIVTDSMFYARVVGGRSLNRTVRVAPTVTLEGPAEGTVLKTGPANKVTFIGKVSPADNGAEVLLQREAATSNEEWHTIQTGTKVVGTGYTLTHRFIAPGDANLRTVVVRFGRFAIRGVSNTLSYEISQTQNPNLTILSSANPVPFGSPVTIAGVVKGAVNQKVTLLGRGAGEKFTSKGETLTDGSGNYTFTIPSAAANTFYRVSSGPKSSAILFEGVKWVLTAGASLTTVPSGTTVTFSGTAAPAAREGHFVYLERQNTFGTGYHVVDLTTLAKGGLYTIPHFVTGLGKEVYRVRIPGDPINQAAASGPITLEVTPPLVAPIKPAPPVKEVH